MNRSASEQVSTSKQYVAALDSAQTNQEPTGDSHTMNNCKPLIIGIVGGSGSGKTVFAERLSKKLGPLAVSLSHDDYYKHLPSMTRAEADVYDFDSPDALDTHLLVEHLRALKMGRPIDVPSYDFAAHSRTDDARHVDPAPIILVEGLLIMSIPDLRSMLDLTIFIDVDPDVRALRRIERDCQERGTDLVRAINMYLNTSKPAHEKLVEPFKKEADIIIPNAMNDLALEVIAEGLINKHTSASSGS